MGYTKKSYRVGLILGNIEDDFSNQVCEGVQRAAEILGDSVFVFPVKYFGREELYKCDILQRYEYQNNNMLAYAQSHSFDVILFCLSTVASCSCKEEYEYLLNYFKDIPVFLIATREEGFPSVVYDNESGLRNGINYIVKQKKCQHIALITGMESNSDAQERYLVFMDVMRENNIEIPDSFIVRGEFDDKCYPLAEKLILENPHLEAIVCANDSIAKAVYAVLKKHHCRIGKDVLVMGFDDLEIAAEMVPPLATVRADAALLGYRGMMEAHALLEKRAPGDTSPLPDSCYVVNTSFINRESLTGIKPKEPEISKDMLLEQKQIIQRMAYMDHLMNICTRDMLMFNSDSIGDYGGLLNSLNSLINDGYLFMLPEPIACHSNRDFLCSSGLYLKAYRKNGETIIPAADEQYVEIHRLFSHPCFQGDATTYYVLDLYSREMQYGILVCTLPHHLLHYTEGISFHVSMAVKVMDLFNIQERLLKNREEMVHQLEAENLLLDNISKKDELTGICNRLGFMSKARELLKTHIDEKAVILYADLNYLKRINDNYSHAEGNFALTTCANLLEETTGDEAIVGRIGGDEFAVLSLLQDADGETLYHRIKDRFVRLNETCDKPYPISLSIGFHEFVIKKGTVLTEVISYADAELYKDKSKKLPFEKK